MGAQEYIFFEASSSNCHYVGGGEKIVAKSLTSAKRTASRKQMFRGTVVKLLKKTDRGVEMVALRDCSGNWYDADDELDGHIEIMWR